jgi:hypothetical protein
LAEPILTFGLETENYAQQCGQSVMLKFIDENAVVIAISLSFSTFGFVLGTRVFDLDSYELIGALIAGAVCGITILTIEFYNSKQSAIRARLCVPTI